jgi:(E)-4-hydroxy-3-methylbut-2-enyl-diphosphate synthase
MKASNPKVMIQAYRLLVQRMREEDMHYPLHLGVTEAGDGEDGRIKSAIGIGSLLLDGLGDTIRVSLTEDSVYEIPVARALAGKAMSQWQPAPAHPVTNDSVDPYHFTRRETTTLILGPQCAVGPEQPPRVIVQAPHVSAVSTILTQLAAPKLVKDTPAEGLFVAAHTTGEIAALRSVLAHAPHRPSFLVLDTGAALTPADIDGLLHDQVVPVVVLHRFSGASSETVRSWAQHIRSRAAWLACEVGASDVAALADTFSTLGDDRLLFTLAAPVSPEPSILDAAPPSSPTPHAVGAYRQLAEQLRHLGSRAPLWIRNTDQTALRGDNSFLSKLLESAILTGSLLCDGLGDLVSIETEADPYRATKLSYNVLQGAGARISKTEFVACPSCGRTLFDLQTTTQRIREKTGHLKGVKLAIMGCIVNGPGEMADADCGYVGGAPGKINLYVGKTCVQYNIPQAEADDRLIALIKEHGKWFDAEPVAAT